MIFVYILVGVVLGAVIGYLIRQSQATKKIGSAENKAERILEEAKNKEKEILLDAKSRSCVLKNAWTAGKKKSTKNPTS